MKLALIIAMVFSGTMSFDPDGINGKNKFFSRLEMKKGMNRRSQYLASIENGRLSFFSRDSNSDENSDLIDLSQKFTPEGRWTISFEEDSFQNDYIAIDVTLKMGYFHEGLQIFEGNLLTSSRKSENRFDNIVFFKKNKKEYIAVVDGHTKLKQFEIFEGKLETDQTFKAKPLDNSPSREILVLKRLN